MLKTPHLKKKKYSLLPNLYKILFYNKKVEQF